jgi:hypothetical protein
MKGHWKWSFNLLHHLFALASLKRVCVHVLQKYCTHKLKSSIVVVACIDKVDWKLVQFSNGSTVAQLVRNILSRNLIKTRWYKIVNIYMPFQRKAISLFLKRKSMCRVRNSYFANSESERSQLHLGMGPTTSQCSTWAPRGLTPQFSLLTTGCW